MVKARIDTTVTDVVIGKPEEFEVAIKLNLRTSTESFIVVHETTYKEMGSPEAGDKILLVITSEKGK